MATYTHVGQRAAVGYQHTGRDFNHYEKRAGKRHALNAVGYRRFEAVCGVVVCQSTNDNHNQGEDNPIEVAIGSELRVTCKACLKQKPVAVAVPKRTKFVVMLDTADGPIRWSSDVVRSNAERYAESIQRAGTASITHPAGYVTRAWVEQIEE